ncbi:MAG: DUF2249 domain-containing protein [Verrucomicrobia bacterium]|nr:DUF2249 domain-containing protein [Verrucomicrobiota bacterium]
MSANAIEHPIDVRTIAPRHKHPTIFNAWNELKDGDSILIINDHDPVPLYYQFACEFEGTFRWEYQDRGPEVWRVRITKGQFADPGFKPAKKPVAPSTVPIEFAKPLTLDTRPYFERGETPCHAIDQAVATLIPGQKFVLVVPFEPVPLYAKLGKEGFSHRAQQLPDGTWQVEFMKSGS